MDQAQNQTTTATTSSAVESTASTSESPVISNQQQEYFNYQIHELYLRPLIDKHNQSKKIQYEDLIQSWKNVEEWVIRYQRQEMQTQGKDCKSDVTTVNQSNIVDKVSGVCILYCLFCKYGP